MKSIGGGYNSANVRWSYCTGFFFEEAQMRHLILVLLIAVLGTNNAVALDYYVGCGTVLPSVNCESCPLNGSGCQCSGLSPATCYQFTRSCTLSPPAFKSCGGGSNCYTVYKHQIPCYTRKACNNANGIESGQCTQTCYQSDEIIYGPDRWEYYTDVPC